MNKHTSAHSVITVVNANTYIKHEDDVLVRPAILLAYAKPVHTYNTVRSCT